MKKLSYYESLLNCNYDEALDKIRKNNQIDVDKNYVGPVTRKNLIMNPSRNKVNTKRQKNRPKGYITHHIKELEISNLGSAEAIRSNPYEFQEKENLIFCDKLEHGILHALIMADRYSKHNITDEGARNAVKGQINDGKNLLSDLDYDSLVKEIEQFIKKYTSNN